MSLPIFEEMRWARADWYTANPMDDMDEATLAALAEQAGMTVDELRAHLATPRVEMTCPLCGRPQTHLTGCKGCGSDAWGWEFQEEYGGEAIGRLRAHLRNGLAAVDEVEEERADYAAKSAYTVGGCMVCAECWRNTLPGDAWQTCPLHLGVCQLDPERPVVWGLTQIIMEAATARSPEEGADVIMAWLEGVGQRWMEIWNTVPEGPEREAVARWRGLLLEVAFGGE